MASLISRVSSFLSVPRAGVHVLLRQKPTLQASAEALRQPLVLGEVEALEQACQQLVDQLCDALNCVRVKVHIMERRSHDRRGELHGLYEVKQRGMRQARIYVWMRTAKRQQLVAYKTFLRTLVHECCHHLDLTHYHLADSLHTSNFYKRESSLYKQLLGND